MGSIEVRECARSIETGSSSGGGAGGRVVVGPPIVFVAIGSRAGSGALIGGILPSARSAPVAGVILSVGGLTGVAGGEVTGEKTHEVTERVRILLIRHLPPPGHPIPAGHPLGPALRPTRFTLGRTLHPSPLRIV